MEWSEVDWLREGAWLSIELEDPMTPEDVAAEEEFDEEIELAAAGEWEALGLDPPEPSPARASDDASPGAGGYQPATIEEFMA